MKTEVKLSSLINVNISINGFLGSADKMDGSSMFKLNKTISAIKPHIEAFETTKKKLVENSASRDEDNELIIEEVEGAKTYKFEEGVLEKVNTEILELLEENVEVELFKIPLSSFEKITFDMSKVLGINIFMELLIDDDSK